MVNRLTWLFNFYFGAPNSNHSFNSDCFSAVAKSQADKLGVIDILNDTPVNLRYPLMRPTTAVYWNIASPFRAPPYPNATLRIPGIRCSRKKSLKAPSINFPHPPVRQMVIGADSCHATATLFKTGAVLLRK